MSKINWDRPCLKRNQDDIDDSTWYMKASFRISAPEPKKWSKEYREIIMKKEEPLPPYMKPIGTIKKKKPKHPGNKDHRTPGHLNASGYNTKALTDTEATKCRLKCGGKTIKELAIKYGVTDKTVERCVYGKTYKHLNAKYPPWERSSVK